MQFQHQPLISMPQMELFRELFRWVLQVREWMEMMP
jgi:hypothetical protein